MTNPVSSTGRQNSNTEKTDRTNQPGIGIWNRRTDRDLDPKPSTDPQPPKTTLEKVQTVVGLALPFLALNPLLGSAISIGMNTTRTFSCIKQTKEAFGDKGTTADKSKAAIQTGLAIAAVAGSIFGNVYGMAITSGHDAYINLSEMLEHIQKGEKEKALEKFLQLAGNALYLTMILNGSLEIMVLSFAAQI